MNEERCEKVKVGESYRLLELLNYAGGCLFGPT